MNIINRVSIPARKYEFVSYYFYRTKESSRTNALTSVDLALKKLVTTKQIDDKRFIVTLTTYKPHRYDATATFDKDDLNDVLGFYFSKYGDFSLCRRFLNDQFGHVPNKIYIQVKEDKE